MTKISIRAPRVSIVHGPCCCGPRLLRDAQHILNSTRSTDFITPKSTASRTFRNAVLQLARTHAFARTLVNSGRLSVPAFYEASPLNTPDTDAFASHMVPGAPIEDVPVSVGGRNGWLLDQVGNRFQLLLYSADPGRVDRSALLNAKLILLLANHIGDTAVLREALDLARDGV